MASCPQPPERCVAAPLQFVMPTEFVMKHMSHLIEKQLQLVDDNDRAFTVTLIQRRNKVCSGPEEAAQALGACAAGVPGKL